ncbi:hypothetical protein MJO29_002441 [Puccinia striiformis f. sp. tritici]|nr:hypothetical protein Pst134EB_003542 [Puccinia striiformis f. sp. tritici]KAI7966693.1 hypothetical protein MJO29_002441 [Puccinia striiformis f. sp. tritici]KAI9609861.1 hypothetical protein H4Q26_006850 [Puccinia striiformis f. sp. tritici PST-130]
MFSKVLLAYVLIALGAIPACLVASPLATAEAEVPGVVAHPLPTINPDSAHVVTPANSTANEITPVTAGHPAANATVTGGGHLHSNDTGIASHLSANTTAPVGPPSVNSTSEHSPANTTTTPGSPSANTTAAPGGTPRSGNGTDTAAGPSPNNATAVLPHAHEPPAPITTCFPKSRSHGIENHHCDKALDKIIFTANHTLDQVSNIVFANYKTCNVHIHKPRHKALTKVQITSMVHNLTTECHSVGGTISQTSTAAIRVERSTKENVYDVDRPMCQREKCPLTQSDCLSAFYQLPTDSNGTFVNGKGMTPFVRVTSGNCTVTASTTDMAAFATTRQSLFPTMKKLVTECAEHPGKIYFSSGTKGLNGDVWLSARPANKNLCE